MILTKQYSGAGPSDLAVKDVGLRPLACGVVASNPSGGMDVCSECCVCCLVEVSATG